MAGVTDFSWALTQLKNGFNLTRKGWVKGDWISLQVPDQNSKMNNPYIFLNTIDGKFTPHVPNQIDLMATDWSLV